MHFKNGEYVFMTILSKITPNRYEVNATVHTTPQNSTEFQHKWQTNKDKRQTNKEKRSSAPPSNPSGPSQFQQFHFLCKIHGLTYDVELILTVLTGK